MSNKKLTAPVDNSNANMPLFVMQFGPFSVEIGSNTDSEDKNLKAAAKELRKRNNAYDGMLMELKESLKDLKGWDGTPDAMRIIQENIEDRIKKAKR